MYVSNQYNMYYCGFEAGPYGRMKKVQTKYDSLLALRFFVFLSPSNAMTAIVDLHVC